MHIELILLVGVMSLEYWSKGILLRKTSWELLRPHIVLPYGTAGLMSPLKNGLPQFGVSSWHYIRTHYIQCTTKQLRGDHSTKLAILAFTVESYFNKRYGLQNGRCIENPAKCDIQSCHHSKTAKLKYKNI